ncbi:MAG TPA: DUF2252 domain-containing protein [Solirubrobacterales bacterium]|nr:DUF2252 domain-containing protein [Solirubrobacterales bacterium]
MAKVARLEHGEDAGRGRAARAATPRSSHAEWEPTADREDPLAILRRQAEARVPELLPIRYGRMVASPFAFYRGAAAVMAADLAATPDSGLVVQLCGDAHISNFGGFAAPDRRLVFGPNDFDETLPGPWEWDVKRMAASIEIAARELGLGPRRRGRIVAGAVAQYREGMREFAAETMLQAWYERLDADELTARFGTRLDADGRELFDRTFAKGRRKDSARAARKLTVEIDGELRFAAAPPLLTPLAELTADTDPDARDAWVAGLLDAYAAGLHADREHLFRAYRFVDMARKVVGVGSVGTRAWVFLFVSHGVGDPLMLQAKEAVASVLEPHLGASEFENHGERVVRGQRMMQAATDIFLSWQRSPGLDGVERDFYVRQLWDWKASADLSRMSEHGLVTYTRACAWSLARSHARSGDRLAIAAYLGKGARFDKAIAEFSRRYADRNEADHARLREAIAAGELEATEGI